MELKPWKHLAHFVVAVVITTSFVVSQQHKTTGISNSGSDEAQRWNKKLEDLQAIVNRSMLINEKTEYVLTLLSEENRIIENAYVLGKRLPEGYAHPYYSTLLSYAVDLYLQNRSSRYFEILATSAFNTNSEVGAVLAQDASSHLDFLINAIKVNKIDATRATLLWMVFRVRDSQGISKDRSEQVLLTGVERLYDPSAYVRAKAIDELSRVKTDYVRARLLEARRPMETDGFVRSEMELRKLDAAITSFRR